MKRPAPARLKTKASAKKTRSSPSELSGTCNVHGLGAPPKKRAPLAAPFSFVTPPGAKSDDGAGASSSRASEDDGARRKTSDARALSDWEEEGGRVADGASITPATHQTTPSRARDAG